MTSNSNDTSRLPSRLVIAIDGPAGSGKSTMAKLLAAKLDCVNIDTGAMYRSVTAKALDMGINVNDTEAVGRVASAISITFSREGGAQKTFADGADYTTRIRMPDVNAAVSIVAAQPAVREKMVALQRKMGKNGRVVMEGRDIGSHVFPDADFKFYLVADNSARAVRRVKDLEGQGITASHDEVKANIGERDRLDSQREASPLVKAPGAIEIDTTHLSIDEVLAKMLERMFPRLA
ncbi:MAG: (d)CMP kinase [Nitrospinae bacterium]|nr:(d)CMP kinase [Nitrospinota bacterium]